MNTDLVTSLLKMDIFFFVTTVLVVVVGILLAVALFYLITTLRSIMRTVRRVEEAVTGVAHDVSVARTYLHGKVAGAKDQIESGAGLVGGYAKMIAKAGLEQVVTAVMKKMGADTKTAKKATKKSTSKKKTDE
jgi:hypothetical protein